MNALHLPHEVYMWVAKESGYVQKTTQTVSLGTQQYSSCKAISLVFHVQEEPEVSFGQVTLSDKSWLIIIEKVMASLMKSDRLTAHEKSQLLNSLLEGADELPLH